jgi:hypothetical protein
MKKIITLLIVTLSLGMISISCSNDESNNSSTSSVVGKWNFSKMSTVINGIASPEIDYDDNEVGCPKDYLELKDGGVYNEGDYYDSACTLDLSTGTWVKNGNTLSITSNGETFSVEVVSVTSTELKLKVSQTDNGITFIINVTLIKA